MKQSIRYYLTVAILALAVSGAHAAIRTGDVHDVIDLTEIIDGHKTDMDLITSAITELLAVDTMTTIGRMFRAQALVHSARYAMQRGDFGLAAYALDSISTSDSECMRQRFRRTVVVSRIAIRKNGRINYKSFK